MKLPVKPPVLPMLAKRTDELPDGPGFVTAEIDLDYLAKVRAELPVLSHRKLV